MFAIRLYKSGLLGCVHQITHRYPALRGDVNHIAAGVGSCQCLRGDQDAAGAFGDEIDSAAVAIIHICPVGIGGSVPSFLKIKGSQRECECVAISITLRRKRNASKVEIPCPFSFNQIALFQTGKLLQGSFLPEKDRKTPVAATTQPINGAR